MYIIAIEGVDGVGKTSLINTIKERYQLDDVGFVSFPTNKAIIARAPTPADKLEAFYEDYKKWYDDNIKERDFWITDRHPMVSSLVYQAVEYKRAGYDLQEVIERVKYANPIMFPDYVILLDARPGTVLERLRNRPNEDVNLVEDYDPAAYMVLYHFVVERWYPGRHAVVNTEDDDYVERTIGIIDNIINKEGRWVYA